MLKRDFAYIDHMCVNAEHRGGGIGRKLVSYAISFAKDNQLARIELDVWTANSKAKLAFNKLGFSRHRERLAYNIER